MINWHWGKSANLFRRVVAGTAPPQHKLVWRQRSDDCWRTTLPLPDLIDKDHIIVPSLSLAESGWLGFRCYLDINDQRSAALAGVASPQDDHRNQAAFAPARHKAIAETCANAWVAGDAPVTAPVDNFITTGQLADARLIFDAYGQFPERAKPDQWHAAVSVRPVTLTTCLTGATTQHNAPLRPHLHAGQGSAARTAGGHVRKDGLWPTSLVSQRTQPGTLAGGGCSPASLSMALQDFGIAADALEIAARTFHRPSQMYGVWPANIHTAAHYGCLAAVSCFDSMNQAVRALDAGFGLVASIRFAAGTLPGAPMAQSGGHLVRVLHVGRSHVLCADPASAQDALVLRNYPRTAFAKCWLQQRGAAYLLRPVKQNTP